MINYRSLKKLLGETSLERKCRLLFGLALLALITTSFWIYATRTRHVMEAQQVDSAHSLVPQILWRRHLTWYAEQIAERTSSEDRAEDSSDEEEKRPDDQKQQLVTAMNWNDFKQYLGSSEELKLDGSWDLILPDGTPSSDEGHEALLEFRGGGEVRRSFQYDDKGTRHLHYFEAVRTTDSCLKCHNGKHAREYRNNEFAAMASVRLSMSDVEHEISRNRAILLASAIVTTFMAMLVAYVIVRYIIVKPVLHLKDVSDEIARGNLNLRAEINTGDEFEELSHAFNRMLRHMTTVNEELRGVNDNLDAKVDLLAQANMELFNSNAMKDEFLATMSHELRTPLNSILGFSDVLAGASNLDDRQKRYVDNIRTSGRNLMVQINDLLDLAKIESGQMKPVPVQVDVRELIENQRNQLLPLADQKNIELRSLFPDEPLPLLNQDIGKLRQILTNLLSNAIKFTPEGGRIRIAAQMIDDDNIEISVEDTGIGIPMHEQDQIFEKFRQGTTSSGDRDHMKREYGGTGLGLSIVRELSRLLGGDVFLESEFGKGSIFMVHLPVEVPSEKPSETIDSPSASGLNRITSANLLNPESSDLSEDKSSETESNETEVQLTKVEPATNHGTDEQT